VEKYSVHWLDMNSGNDANRPSGPDDTSAKKAATKIRIIEDAEATGETAAAYDFWRAGSGRQQVPGIIKCFGTRPDFLRRVIELGNTIHFSEGHLSRRHKEMIASYVSYLNRCPY
jgi:Carboxymuconolactone decarboxylase family